MQRESIRVSRKTSSADIESVSEVPPQTADHQTMQTQKNHKSSIVHRTPAVNTSKVRVGDPSISLSKTIRSKVHTRQEDDIQSPEASELKETCDPIRRVQTLSATPVRNSPEARQKTRQSRDKKSRTTMKHRPSKGNVQPTAKCQAAAEKSVRLTQVHASKKSTQKPIDWFDDEAFAF